MTRHPLFALFLTLVLAAGGFLSGLTQAQGGGTTVELCSGAGAVTVTLDAQGKPVLDHRPCPLCLAAQDLGPVPAPAGWSRPDVAAQAAILPPAEPREPQARRLVPAARAPPLPV